MAAAKSSRVNRKYKTKYRIRNWKEYERGLRSRGDVTIWLSEEAIAAWTPEKNDRSDQTLGESILPGTSRCRQHLLDAHALDSLPELVAIDPIAVVQQIARRCVLRKGLDHLLARPERRGISGHVEMHDTPTLLRKDHEYVQDPETDRGDGEEIQRHQVPSVIVQKDPPALRRRLTGLGKQTRDRAFGNLETQLE